jgi:hypothetical protein
MKIFFFKSIQTLITTKKMYNNEGVTKIEFCYIEIKAPNVPQARSIKKFWLNLKSGH